MSTPEILAYYAEPGPLTSDEAHRALFDPLPTDVAELCQIVHGLLIHRNWAPAYQTELTEQQGGDAQARSLPAILDRLLAHDDRPLDETRPPDRRFAGTCRDFSVMLCSFLRHQGVPARARCGFGTYFAAGHYEDHWVCERWSESERRWILTDAQLDEFQVGALKLDFDPLDVPRERFQVAGDVWQGCREGRIAPELCGIFDMRGLWFVRGNVPRDLASLNRVELLPWDDWGLVLRLGGEDTPADDLPRLDRAAEFGHDPDATFSKLRELYESDPELHVPERVRNWQTGADEIVRPGGA